MRNDIVKIANMLKDDRVVTVCYNAVNGIQKMKLRLGFVVDFCHPGDAKKSLISSESGDP